MKVFHKKGTEWCLAWKILDVGHYIAWREGTVPLSSQQIELPNGKHPDIGTQVACGTCRESRLVPKEFLYQQT